MDEVKEVMNEFIRDEKICFYGYEREYKRKDGSVRTYVNKFHKTYIQNKTVLTDDLRAQINKLKEDGMSTKGISKELKISIYFVNKELKKDKLDNV